MSHKQVGIGIEYSQKQLKSLLRKNEAVISKLQQSIGSKRKQLHQFSNSITKIIEKKIVYKNTHNQQYKHPNFNPHYGDEGLDGKNDLKESLYKQIQDIKSKINVIKDSQESAVIHEAHRKKNIIKRLDSQIKKYEDQRELLKIQMDKNKEMLTYYKNSPCISQIQATQKQLEQTKKQAKLLEKQYNEMLAAEIMENIYFYGMKTEKEKIQSIQEPEPGNRPVSPTKINSLMTEVNNIIQDRNIFEKKSQSQANSLTRNITNLLHQNNQIQRRIRNLQGEYMKKQLQVRHIKGKQKQRDRAQTLRERQQQIIKNRLKNLKLRSSYQTPQNHFRSNDKNQRRDTIFMNQKTPAKEDPVSKQIIIGEWIEQTAARDFETLTFSNSHMTSPISHKPQIKKIEKLIRMKIKVDKEQPTIICEIVAEYVDHQGVQHESGGIDRFLRSKTEQVGKKEKEKIEEIETTNDTFIIDLEDVQDFRYMPQQTKKLGIKWVMRDGRVIQTGDFSEESFKDIISMDKYCIHQMDFCLNESFTHIVGLKIILKEPQKQIQFRNSIKLPQKNWRSNSEISLLTKKKVFVKPMTHQKKSNDLGQIDHRLLLNRRKKNV